jgi:glucose/arabinose dehydrogenase
MTLDISGLSSSSIDLYGQVTATDGSLSTLSQLGTSRSQNLVFIAADLADIDTLVRGFGDARIVLLDRHADGIAQITDVLDRATNVTSVRVVSHGSAGDVFLGDSHLNLGNLQNYRDDLQQWRNALAPGADILFYGCNVGAGAVGLEFIREVSHLTGADVAASNDITGKTALGGDWDLEVATGSIETEATAIGDYDGILPTYNGKEYRLTTTAKSWTGAQAEAQSVGGNLVTINDAAEETWLKQTFGDTNTLWIGLTDRATEGNFQWVNGETTTYRNWKPGEPNDYKFDGAFPDGEDYVGINFGEQKQWNDFPDSYAGTAFGIIEIADTPTATPLFTFNNFTSSNIDKLALNGVASQSGNRLRLVPDTNFQVGSAFFKQALAIDSNTSFSTQFQFQLSGTQGTGGADGFTFMLQNDPNGSASLGRFAGELGYGGINNSIAIEFDTYQNGSDANNNNISILRNGDVSTPITTALAAFDLNSGNSLTAWVDYTSATKTLQVFLANSNTKPTTAALTTNIDLTTALGNRAYLGFSGATGGASNIEEIQSWTLSSNSQLLPAAATSTLGLRSSVYQVNETGNRAIVTVDRLQSSEGTVSLDYRTIDATATAGNDYTAVSGRLTFAPGETSKTIDIPILNDTLLEGNESFNLTIDNPIGNAILLAPRTATVTIVDDEAPTPLFSFPNFANTAELNLNGNTTQSGNNLRLTPDAATQAGSAFLKKPLAIDGNTSFSTQFQFQLTGAQGTNGADGFTFVLQNNGSSKEVGGAGGALGLGGIGKSLAIEFDTYQHGFDQNNNNISILRDGNVVTPLATVAAPFDLNSGQALNAWIDYDGATNNLRVYLANNATKPTTATLAANVDLAAIVGTQAFIGFTAATGGLGNDQDIQNWVFSSNSTLLPEPPALTIQKQVTTSNLNQPTAIDWTPDGTKMFVAEKEGLIKVVVNGQTQATPFIDLRDAVNSASDRGLLDIAVHPDFLNGKPYVYALYAYDPPEAAQNTGLAGKDDNGNRASRLTRITADPATNYTTAVAGSEVVILGRNSTWNNFNAFVNSTTNFDEPAAGVLPNGTNLQDFLNLDSQSHAIGSVEFGTDGALYVSNGDGASYNQVDPRAVRVQDIDNLSGKILRIDPITGAGLADNPFYNGDPNSNRSKVYQSGLRNPFRITVQPNTGKLFVGDVGWSQWEEINSAPAGANFGWPYYEGGNGTNNRTGEYQNLPQAQAFYASGRPVQSSILGLNHADDGINAIVLGDFYTGNVLPTQYRGDLFFNDLGQGIVRNVNFDASGRVLSTETFTTDSRYVVQIAQGPDGNLYYVDLDDGTIGRWVAQPPSTLRNNSAPPVKTTPNPSFKLL